MSLEVFTQFNKLQQPIASQQIGMTTTMPSLIDTEPDFFETHEGKSATSAGIILAVGMAARGFLKKLSDGFFAKYFSKNQNIDEEDPDNNPDDMENAELYAKAWNEVIDRFDKDEISAEELKQLIADIEAGKIIEL